MLLASGAKALADMFSAASGPPRAPGSPSWASPRPLPLTELDLSDARLCGFALPGAMAHTHDCAVSLLTALQSATQLTHLNLGGNKLPAVAGAALAALVESPSSKLRHLLLDRNMLGNDGTEAIARALRTHKDLLELRLDENFISETVWARDVGGGHLGAWGAWGTWGAWWARGTWAAWVAWAACGGWRGVA